jgi:hypothetical protein
MSLAKTTEVDWKVICILIRNSSLSMRARTPIALNLSIKKWQNNKKIPTEKRTLNDNWLLGCDNRSCPLCSVYWRNDIHRCGVRPYECPLSMIGENCYNIDSAFQQIKLDDTETLVRALRKAQREWRKSNR